MAGRKGFYTPKTLKIGQKMALRGAALNYPYQYVSSFRKKSGHKLRVLREGRKLFIERIG